MKEGAPAVSSHKSFSVKNWGESGHGRWVAILWVVAIGLALPKVARSQTEAGTAAPAQPPAASAPGSETPPKTDAPPPPPVSAFGQSGPMPTFVIGGKNGVPVNVKGSFEIEFNDNINYSNSNKSSDIILRPGIVVGINYRLTQINTLALQLGLSYDQYVFHPDLSSYTNFASVSPDSQLAYTLKPSESVSLTIYDSFNYSVQPSDALSVNPNTGKVITDIKAFGRFMNQIGIKGDYQAGPETVFYGGVYRYDVFPQNSDYDFLRRWQYTATAGARQTWGAYTFNLDGSYTLNYYKVHLENDSSSWYVAPTVTWVSQSLTLKGTVGFTGYNFKSNGTNGDSSQPSTYVGELSAIFPLSSTVSNTITGSRSSNFGYVSNAITVDRISYKIEHTDFLFKNMVGSLLAYYERGHDSGGTTPERYEKYTISPQLDYNVSKKLTLYSSYEFTQKYSNFGARNYTRNRFIIGLRYDF